MKKKLLNLFKKPLIAGSLWLTFGNFFSSFGNYLFNLLMGRLLTAEDYGALASLISLSIFISLPTSIITMILVKFSATFYAQKKFAQITRLAKKFSLYGTLGGFLIFVFFIVANSFLQDFLKIYDQRPFIVMGLLIWFGLIGAVNTSLLQGLLKFKVIAVLGILTVIVKLILGWYFVKINFNIFGPLLALLLASILTWLITFIPLKRFYQADSQVKFGLRKKILSFSFPTFATTATATLFLSTDLILVKHYFPPQEAGIYAAVSVMGKVVFYALSPISQVCFPVIAQRFAKGKKWLRDTALALLLIGLPGIIGLSIYFLFPQLVIKIFFPKEIYRQTASLIILYASYMLIFSFSSLLTNVYLAVEKAKLIYLALGIAILRLASIVFLHQNLSQVIWVSIVTAGLLLAAYLAYLGKLLFLKQKRLGL